MRKPYALVSRITKKSLQLSDVRSENLHTCPHLLYNLCIHEFRKLSNNKKILTLSSPIITSSITLHSPSFTNSGRPNVDTISPPKKKDK